MVSSAQHCLTKSLVDIVERIQLLHSQHCISDSFTFANQIQNISSEPNNSFFCSFDAVSLYTNILMDKTITICADTLYHDHLDPTPVPEPIFLKLILIATKDVQFSFNNTMYQQIDEISMGSPLGATMVNIFVGFQEAKLFKIINMLLFTKRYVDDTFMIFFSKSESKHFFHIVNQLLPALTFTCKFEHNDILPFLDIFVDHNNFGIQI